MQIIEVKGLKAKQKLATSELLVHLQHVNYHPSLMYPNEVDCWPNDRWGMISRLQLAAASRGEIVLSLLNDKNKGPKGGTFWSFQLPLFLSFSVERTILPLLTAASCKRLIIPRIYSLFKERMKWYFLILYHYLFVVHFSM